MSSASNAQKRHWSDNKGLGLQEILSLGFPRAFHEEGSVSNLLVLLRVPAVAWKPFCTAKGDSLLSGFSSLADVRTIYLRQLSLVMNKSVSESESSSSGLVRFIHLCNAEDPTEEAISREKEFTTLSPHPPPSPTRGCIGER